MTLSITSRLVMQAAMARGWRVDIHPGASGLYSIVLPSGTEYVLKGLQTHKTSALGKYICDQKEAADFIARRLGISVPAAEVFEANHHEAVNFLRMHKVIVIKPSNSSHGNGITVGVKTTRELKQAFDIARRYSKTIIAQKYIDGDDYRILIIGGKLAAAALRKPASVVGDGVRGIADLIQDENQSDRRAAGYQEKLTHINVRAAELFLGDKLLSVPKEGTEIAVVGTANVGKGGTATDVTDNVDARLVEDAVKLADNLRLGVCGVDFLVTKEGRRYLIEANAAPSLGLHEHPHIGKARKTPDAFLDWLTESVHNEEQKEQL